MRSISMGLAVAGSFLCLQSANASQYMNYSGSSCKPTKAAACNDARIQGENFLEQRCTYDFAGNIEVSFEPCQCDYNDSFDEWCCESQAQGLCSF